MRKYYTAQDVADTMSVNVETIRRAIKSGHLKAARIGNTYRISERDIHRFYWNLGGSAPEDGEASLTPENGPIAIVPFAPVNGVSFLNCPICGLKFNHIHKVTTAAPGLEQVTVSNEGVAITSEGNDVNGAVVDLECCCESAHKFLLRFSFDKGKVFTLMKDLGTATSDEMKQALPRR